MLKRPTISSRTCSAPSAALKDAPRVIIVGGGFGGITVLKQLRGVEAEVVLIDKRNYHLFQPLLYQVATAALNPAQIAVPLRKAVEIQSNCSVFMADVTDVDVTQKRVYIGEKRFEYSYDYLVIATGAQTNYFGKDEWVRYAPGLKSIEEALSVRQRFLLAFEQAEVMDDPVQVAELLTFVIVGGGPTGVELAGAMAEIAHTTLKCSFRRFNAATARVILLDSGERLLKTFSTSCSERAKKDLELLGVEVISGARVTDVTATTVSVRLANSEQKVINTRQVIWAAGVKGNVLGEKLGVELDSGGRVKVEADLRIPGYPSVFVIGDLASSIDRATKKPVPGVAQGAIQMGDFVGKLIATEIKTKISDRSKSFRYRDKGSMATIGRGKAVVTIGKMAFGGFVAWIMWAIVHVVFLVGFRNRVGILIQWVWMFFFFERGVRLITGNGKELSMDSFPRDCRTAQITRLGQDS